MRYKVTMNWKGELHEFYTNSRGELSALANCIVKLSKKLKVSRYAVSCHFSSGKDNFKVERR